ncbi:TetR family transcriptional regulator [Prauserella shujinwangii]|uniref:TetR family transcriptional regulator n=1 Tax=Prauserella shujinwangii TaxID=1453103 RepID=A0A2T0LNC9_9PSEU|nr:TetR/AcrR family transcriptional regulator [Prauserella shujinwangii]PRX44611.1 TetR family transcriptional regulator [Prauserella shujinwangii]
MTETSPTSRQRRAPRTARERARAELTAAIKEEARRQLAEVGAHGLSLRAVARELGMVSSALYRYFPSRDELLTALIVDAYDALGEAGEVAVARESVACEQWRAACRAMRDWARAHPHEYSLIYGSPVPGYVAPERTIAPAERAPRVLIETLRTAWGTGGIEPATPQVPVPAALRTQAETLGRSFAPDLPLPILLRGVVAWTQLTGMIGLELTGHFVGVFEPADAFFTHSVEELMAFVGLH